MGRVASVGVPVSEAWLDWWAQESPCEDRTVTPGARRPAFVSLGIGHHLPVLSRSPPTRRCHG